MKHSSLHIDYTAQTCIFNNVKVASMDKEHISLNLTMWIHSQGNEFNLTLDLSDYVIFNITNDHLYLEFKSPCWFNNFLSINKDKLANFKISKHQFLDIKGI